MQTNVPIAASTSLKLHKIDSRVMHELRRRGHADHVIAKMTPEYAFAEVCKYNGIMNPAKGQPHILANLRQAAA